MLQQPFVPIFVRHSSACPHRDEFHKRCDCWKHRRWSFGGKPYRKAAKSRTWAGAERARREIELSYENAALGKPVQSDEAVSVERAIKVFLADKEGQNMKAVTLKKYRGERRRS